MDNNTSPIVRNDVQTSTVEVISTRKPYQKMNGVKQTETNNYAPNKINEQENETNSGHSSSNESNNIDKGKKGII